MKKETFNLIMPIIVFSFLSFLLGLVLGIYYFEQIVTSKQNREIQQQLSSIDSKINFSCPAVTIPECPVCPSFTYSCEQKEYFSGIQPSYRPEACEIKADLESLGYNFRTITGMSMQPSLWTGYSLIEFPATDIQEGDIVQNEPSNIMHRVRGIYSDSFVTQGDSNPYNDGNISKENFTKVYAGILFTKDC